MSNPEIDVVVVNFSFGLGSFCAAKRMVDEFGKDKVLLLFADTKWEDEDTYKWGRTAAGALGCRKVEISDGRTPWELFNQTGFIGNSRIDPCSKVLKRDLINNWLKHAFNPRRTLLVFGIHWSEQDRFYTKDKKTNEERGIFIKHRDIGWKHIRAPLCERPFISYPEMEQMGTDAGLWKQNLYRLGFSHANCGGRCVKQGQTGWALLYRTMPNRFIEVRDEEEAFRKRTGKDVSMLKETRDGVKYPLPLVELQRRLDAGQCEVTGDPITGGCNCFTDYTEGNNEQETGH